MGSAPTYDPISSKANRRTTPVTSTASFVSTRRGSRRWPDGGHVQHQELRSVAGHRERRRRDDPPHAPGHRRPRPDQPVWPLQHRGDVLAARSRLPADQLRRTHRGRRGDGRDDEHLHAKGPLLAVREADVAIEIDRPGGRPRAPSGQVTVVLLVRAVCPDGRLPRTGNNPLPKGRRTGNLRCTSSDAHPRAAAAAGPTSRPAMSTPSTRRGGKPACP